MAIPLQSFPTRFLATDFNTVTITVTLQIALHYSTHKVFESHVKSSQPDSVVMPYQQLTLKSAVQFSQLLRLKVKVEVTFRLTVSQSVCMYVLMSSPRWYLLLFDNYGLVFMGHTLWQEDGSLFCICCWPLSAQSFSVSSPLRLTTIFYCLRFETSFSSPFTTRRVTVEVFDLASTRVSASLILGISLYSRVMDLTENPVVL
jgi:hypothetical protein